MFFRVLNVYRLVVGPHLFLLRRCVWNILCLSFLLYLLMAVLLIQSFALRCPAFIDPSALVAADGVGFGSAAPAPRRLGADMRLRCAWPEGGSNRFSFIAGELLWRAMCTALVPSIHCFGRNCMSVFRHSLLNAFIFLALKDFFCRVSRITFLRPGIPFFAASF